MMTDMELYGLMALRQIEDVSEDMEYKFKAGQITEAVYNKGKALVQHEIARIHSTYGV